MANDAPAEHRDWLSSLIHGFEQITVTTLVVLMMTVIALSIVELVWILVRDIIAPPVIVLDIDQLLDLFGVFLLVLIGLELLETIKAYLTERVIYIEVVLEVAIIALARKIIVLQLSKYSGLGIVGLAALLLALAGTFYVVRTKGKRAPPS